MAQTFVKTSLIAFTPNDALMEAMRFSLPEAASATFLKGSPVIFSSGYIAVGSDPITTCAGFAMEDAHNGSAGANYIKILPAAPGSFVHLYGNWLTTAAADNALAAADLGAKGQINYEATGGSDGSAIWHFGDDTNNPGVKVVSFDCDPGSLPQRSSTLRAAAGDTNARVTAVLLDSAADWAA